MHYSQLGYEILISGNFPETAWRLCIAARRLMLILSICGVSGGSAWR